MLLGSETSKVSEATSIMSRATASPSDLTRAHESLTLLKQKMSPVSRRSENDPINKMVYARPEGISQGVQRGISQGISQAVPLGISYGAPQGIPQNKSYGVSQPKSYGMPQGLSQPMSYGMSQGISKGISQPNSQLRTLPAQQGVSHGLSNGLSQKLSQGISHGLSQGLSQGTSHGLSQGLSHGVSHGASHGASHGLSQASQPQARGGRRGPTAPKLQNVERQLVFEGGAKSQPQGLGAEFFEAYETPLLEAPRASNDIVQPSQSEPLVPCDIGCGRSFVRAALEKHRKVCAKVFLNRRKKFDTAGMRVEAICDENNINVNAYKPKVQTKAVSEKPLRQKMSKWKIESLQLRSQLRPQNAVVSQGLSKADKEIIEFQKMQVDTRLRCPHCARGFEEKVLERHKPHCEAKAKANRFKEIPRKNLKK